jgi:hypothetical protein
VHETYGERLPETPWLIAPRLRAQSPRATGTDA